MVTRPIKAFQNFARQTASRLDKRRTAAAVALLGTTSPYAIKQAPKSERKAVQRAIKFLTAKNPNVVRNWYEGGFPLSDGGSSWLPELLADARYDQNSITRRELMRRCRYWEKNSPLMKRALDLPEQYVIGTHMPVVTSTATDSTGWCQRAEQVFHEMSHSAGLNDESLFSMLCVGFRRKKVDGNVLFVETSKPGSVQLKPGVTLPIQRPCFQMVEGHRIETPFNMWDREGLDIIDGVQYKRVPAKLANGRSREQLQKVGYWVKDAPNDFINNESYSLIPAENCYYATSAHRVNEPRGVSDFYAVEMTLALLEDLLKLEMRAQEVQSDIALFITNGAGQVVDPSAMRTISQMGIKLSTDGSGKPVVTSDDVKKVTEIYQKIWGGSVRVGRTGDTLTPMAPTRPAEATLNLWEFLIDSFCMGARLPRILMFPRRMKGQGTEVRAELESANAAWRSEFSLVWKPLVHRAWVYFIGWAIKNDPRLADPPADWQSIEVSPPRSVVVDLGYDSAAKIAEMAAGITNTHFIAQDLGTTEDRLIAASVRSLAKLKKACAEIGPQFGVELDAAEVRQSLGDVLKNLAAAEASKALADNPKKEEEEPANA